MATENNSELKEQINLTKELIQVVLGKPSFFKSTRDLFKEYWAKLQNKRPEKVTQEVHHYSGEALGKFWQLDFLLEKTKELETSMESKRQEVILNGDPIQKWLQDNKINENGTTTTMPKIDDLKAMVESSRIRQCMRLNYTQNLSICSTPA
ncbi:MAG: hypothetical protein WDO16_11020 [Bacteroidota bacterium]